MFKSGIDLYGKSWIDTVFEGRNKKYGAYEMRDKESGRTVRALVIGAVVFCLLISLPLIMKQIAEARGRNRTIDEKVTLVTLDLPKTEIPDQPPPPPPPKPEVKSLQEVKKFTPPVVAPDEQVIEELVKQEDLKDVKIGAKNIEGDDQGVVVIDEKPVEEVVRKIVEDTHVYDTKTVQVEPQFPGGIQKFREYIMSGLEGVINNIEGTNELQMKFQFVIEKNGKLTDIKVLSDGGNSEAAEKAVQVLSSSPKWEPAMVNGKPVRMLFVIPIIAKIFN